MPGCKFCRKDKKLIEAHIIPQAFVRKKVKEYMPVIKFVGEKDE